MNRLITGLVAALAVTVSLAFPAEATRVMPHNLTGKDDVCKNIRGIQPIWLIQGYTAIPRYKFIVRTARPKDCTWSDRLHHMR